MKVRINELTQKGYSNKERDWLVDNQGRLFNYENFSANYIKLEGGYFCHIKDCSVVVNGVVLDEIKSNEPSRLQILEWRNRELRDALQYLLDTKERKDELGVDSLTIQREGIGWMKAKNLLNY